MAFDSKRLKTFDWLVKIAQKTYRFPFIMAYCGSLYATDEIVLAKVDYPEFEHLSDWEWSNVVCYKDDDGLLLETPEIEMREKQFFDNRIFDKFFDEKFTAMQHSINLRVLKTGLKGFEINRINPIVYTSENKVYLMGHNKDVSIRVCMMGMR